MVENPISAAEIVSDLLRNNVCKYCSLRFINEKNPSAYINIESHMKKVLGKSSDDEYSPASKVKKPNPCSACLGLLQIQNNDEFLDKVVNEVISAGYDSDDVTFALSLPITLMLRDCSIWLYVSEKYSNVFNGFDSVSLHRTMNTVAVKEAWKWVAAQPIADRMKKRVNNGVNGTFHVNIHIEYDKDSEETGCLVEMFPEVFKCRSSQKRKFHGEILTRKSVENALLEIELDYFKKFYPVPPLVPDNFIKCSNIECLQDSIYVAGRYNKFSRNLSQTPWLINGERRMESSVEEIISDPVSRVIQCSGIKFSSSGREDVDVRTLGKGRPFVLEVANPRKTKLDFATMRKIEKDINESSEHVSVRDLQLVHKDELSHIKMGEQSKTKTYSCFCIAKLSEGEDLDAFITKLKNLGVIKDLVIQQKTPIRVLHRRSLAVRPRTIFWLKADFHELKNDQIFFKLTLQVEAGTYIKEFVHGDFSRTKPNLTEILEKETDILALDVEEVALHWPPSIENEGGSEEVKF